MEFIEFTIKVSEKDYRDGAYFTAYGRYRLFNIIYIFAVLVYIMLAIKELFTTGIDLFTLICSIILVFVPVFGFFSLEYSIKKFIKTDRNHFGALRRYELGEHQLIIHELNTTQMTSFDWDKIYRAYETKTYFFIYVNSQALISVPKRELPEEMVPKIRLFLSNRLDKKFILKFRPA